MAETQRESADGDNAAVAPPGEPPPARPRWVKVLVALAVVVAVFAIVMLLVGGEHGPGRHLPSGGSGGETAPAEHAPPPGGH